MGIATRQLIMEGTVKLAQLRPVNKITVKNITDECRITRNTFYYYFHDIYDVLNSFLQEKLDEITANDISHSEQTIFEQIKMCCGYKKLWNNIYKSMGHDNFARYVTNKIHTMLKSEISAIEQEKEISNLDMYLITGFYEEAFSGLLIRWIKDEKIGSSGEDLQDVLKRMIVLFRGQLILMLSNAQKDN